MRSLPPPRITRARRWKRIKRAIKNLFTKGYISDFGVFHRKTMYSRHLYTISKIHRSPILARMKKTTSDVNVNVIRSANCGLIFVRYFSKLITKTSVPGLREDVFGKRSKFNLSLKV